MLSLIVTLIILGLIFYFVEMIPIAEPFPKMVRIVAIIIAIIVVLDAFGLNILPLHLN